MKATNIQFINGTRCMATRDETQFDTTDRAELAELWLQFCIDEKIIEGIEEVEIEDDYPDEEIEAAKEKLQGYWDKDFYEIYEDYQGKKMIRVDGYVYNPGIGHEGDGKDCRVLQYSAFCMPLEEFIAPDFDYDSYQSVIKQWITEVTEADALKAMLHFFGVEPYAEMPYDKLTMETPFGKYVNYGGTK